MSFVNNDILSVGGSFPERMPHGGVMGRKALLFSLVVLPYLLILLLDGLLMRIELVDCGVRGKGGEDGSSVEGSGFILMTACNKNILPVGGVVSFVVIGFVTRVETTNVLLVKIVLFQRSLPCFPHRFITCTLSFIRLPILDGVLMQVLSPTYY